MNNRLNTPNLLAPCDIYKDEEKIVVRMEMPGVARERLSINVEGNLLIVEGQKENLGIEGEYRVREILQGNYYHEITLDNTIDRSSIDAKLEKGILILEMKLQESQKPRKITVKGS